MRIFGTLIVILLMMAACRLQNGPQSEISSLNSTIEKDEPAVLKIVSRFPILDEQGNQLKDEQGFPQYKPASCSMTAYAPNAAVTAAHCVMDPETGKIADPKNKDIFAVLPDDSHFFATDVAVHPDWVVEWLDENGQPTTPGNGKPASVDPAYDQLCS